MSEAVKLIVDSYVRLGDIKALTELKAHRVKLLTDMRIIQDSAFDVKFVTDVLETEIELADDGLARLSATPPDHDAGK